jgi:hypothetical protein
LPFLLFSFFLCSFLLSSGSFKNVHNVSSSGLVGLMRDTPSGRLEQERLISEKDAKRQQLLKEQQDRTATKAVCVLLLVLCVSAVL